MKEGGAWIFLRQSGDLGIYRALLGRCFVLSISAVNSGTETRTAMSLAFTLAAGAVENSRH